MANILTDFPDGLFTIWSHADDKYLVLTDDSQPNVIPTKLFFKSFVASANQFWIAIKLSNMGAADRAYIYNVGTERVMQYFNNNGTAQDLDLGTASPDRTGQTWVLYSWENNAGLYSLRPAVDDSKCLNVGSDKKATLISYASNSSTQFAIREEQGTITPIVQNSGTPTVPVMKIAQGVFSNQASGSKLSTAGESVIVDNKSMDSTEFNGSIALTYEDEQSHAFTKTNTQTVTKTVTASLGISGILAKILTIKADLSYSESYTDTSTFESSETHTITTTHQYTCEAKVPGGKAYKYAITTESIPFTADYTVSVYYYPDYPNAAGVEIQLPSKYSGRNTTSVVIKVIDVTALVFSEHTEISSITVPIR